MLYFTGYKDEGSFFCKFSGDGFEVARFGKSFWSTFLTCFVKALFLELKLKIKKLSENGESFKNSGLRDVCSTNKH
jgi:hypothetical protein